MTYFTMFENEVRLVQVAITDQDDQAFTPTFAYTSVVDEDGSTLVPEVSASVVDNNVYMNVDTTVSSTPGEYEIIWKIVKTVGSVNYTYYHKTHLMVEKV